MPLTSGFRLGPYEIAGPLGAGGMGEVYRARDPRLVREVAIKILPAAFAEDQDRLRRFEQEARAAGSLNHPAILAIHDIGSHGGCPYIVSELLEGETLRERLSGEALPVRRATEIVQQVAHGLAAAHDRGIVHRDLKPENLFLTRDGRVKILDFGLARQAAGGMQPGGSPAPASMAEMPTTPMGTSPGIVLGTVGYMSPEQVRGEPAGPRSDLFSLGAVLYETLTGRRAFKADTAAETMTAILRSEPPDVAEVRPEVPPALARIVSHCLEKAPEQRYQSARDLAFALEGVSTVSTGRQAARAGDAGGWRIVSALRRPVVAGFGLIAAAVGVAVGLALRPETEEGSSAAQVSFQRLTFRRGFISSARFTPDGEAVVYSAAWDGQSSEIFQTRPGSGESLPLGLANAELLSISPAGEMAIKLVKGIGINPYFAWGTLARVPLSGGAPREISEGVLHADWSPDGQTLSVARRGGERGGALEYPIGRVVSEATDSPLAPRVSPRGEHVAYFEGRAPVSCSVAVVDRSGKHRVLSRGWIDWWFLDWSPDGREVWFGAGKSGLASSLYAVDLDGRLRTLAQAPGTLELHDVHPSGRTLVTRVGIRSFVKVRVGGVATDRDLSWLEASLAVTISPDGRFLLLEVNSEAFSGKPGIYLRGIDGAPPIRLGEGVPHDLSPGGDRVVASTGSSPQHLVIIPVRAGEAHRLEGGFETISSAKWLPDGKRIVIAAREVGMKERLHLIDADGGDRRSLSGEGFTLSRIGSPVSPDGRWVVAVNADSNLVLHPVEEGEPRPLPGTEPGEGSIGWSGDGRNLYVYRRGLPTSVYKVELPSDKRELVMQLRPEDAAGVGTARSVLLTPDGRTVVYSHFQVLSELYLVEGLK
jgi:Tol biopolymer transport system component